jgi:hypothetical protein
MPPKRGRPKAPGKYYRFGIRFRPGLDPEELETLLERIEAAQGEAKAAILRAALLGGAEKAEEAAGQEAEEVGDILDGLFDFG